MNEFRRRSTLSASAHAAAITFLLVAALPFAAQAIPPTVEIASPASGATICGTITVSATASDSLGVAGVRFQYNGIDFAGEDTSLPYGVFAHTNNVADGVYTLTATARNLLGEQTTSAPVTVTVDNISPNCSPKFIPKFLVYYGGGLTLTCSDAGKLAKFDLLDVHRWRYFDIAPSPQCPNYTWAAVKAVNPNTKIYLYEMGAEDQNFDDNTDVRYLEGIDRYNILADIRWAASTAITLSSTCWIR